MRTLNAIVLTLVIIGAINWGLVGAFNFNLVSAIFGDMSAASRIIYVLVGLAGLYAIAFYPLVSHAWSEAGERSWATSPRPTTV